MQYGIYAIHDKKIGYMAPFINHSDETAKRSFIAGAQEKEPNAINTYSEDKSLWRLGNFDDNTGELISSKEWLMDAPERRKEDGNG